MLRSAGVEAETGSPAPVLSSPAEDGLEEVEPILIAATEAVGAAVQRRGSGGGGLGCPIPEM